MEYSIKKVAELSGVSTRTLRYYDEINLLTPTRINSSGYRIYGSTEIDKLQQILFYRAMDIKLDKIKILLENPLVDSQSLLKEHYKYLLEKREQLDQLITTVQKTLDYQKGAIQMTDEEKFYGLKKEQLATNEKKYGNELREKYGEDKLSLFSQHWLNLSKKEFSAMEVSETEVIEELKNLMLKKNITSSVGKSVFLKHKEWLSYTSPTYSQEFHQSMGELYISDPRFTAYYDDKAGIGATKLLNDIIQYFTTKKSWDK